MMLVGELLRYDGGIVGDLDVLEDRGNQEWIADGLSEPRFRVVQAEEL